MAVPTFVGTAIFYDGNINIVRRNINPTFYS